MGSNQIKVDIYKMWNLNLIALKRIDFFLIYKWIEDIIFCSKPF